uniref:relaxase/mobilization nuclease domain-containing protein n=1 Tax=Bacteroides fragilis TaxID=817 RepID=UPI0035698974
MVVKILKNAKSFSAVDYNETRVEKGEAMLVATNNFGAMASLFSSSPDYEKYFRMWSQRNTRIKKPQFHVTISCKDKEYSKEQLTKIGEEWLQKMGYGNNPYMIYFHQNTKNNHIHIISSRVDKNGCKISDKFEKERAIRYMDAIIGNNRKEKVRADINKALHYSFSSTKQFMMILESMGYSVYEKDGKINIASGGCNESINKSLCDFCSLRYRNNEDLKRKRQNIAITKKYATLLSRVQFQDFMKSKFGLSFVFFGKEENPYGYCVIDHSHKIVYSGKEIMPIKELIRLLNAEKKDIDFELMIREKLNQTPDVTQYLLNRQIMKHGAKIVDGNVVSLLTGEILCQLEDSLKEKIKYNNKLDYCVSKYHPQTEAEIMYLSKQFDISIDDLKERTSDCESSVINYYKNLVEELIVDGKLKEGMEEQGIRIFKGENEFLFIDYDRNIVLSNERLGIDFDELEVNMDTSYVYSKRYSDDDLNDNESLSISEELIELVDSVTSFVHIDQSSTGGEKPKKKRRKK